MIRTRLAVISSGGPPAWQWAALAGAPGLTVLGAAFAGRSIA